MAPRSNLTYEEVASLLRYDPETGSLLRISGRHAGKEAGVFNCGYIRVRIGEERLYAHVLAWLLMTKTWPGAQLDHVNGNRADNRWINIRPASRQDNSRNCVIYSNNKSGFKGVYKQNNAWRADITVNEKTLHLGSFQSPEAAHEAYVVAAKHYFGEFANAG